MDSQEKEMDDAPISSKRRYSSVPSMPIVDGFEANRSDADLFEVCVCSKNLRVQLLSLFYYLIEYQSNKPQTSCPKKLDIS